MLRPRKTTASKAYAMPLILELDIIASVPNVKMLLEGHIKGNRNQSVVGNRWMFPTDPISWPLYLSVVPSFQDQASSSDSLLMNRMTEIVGTTSEIRL